MSNITDSLYEALKKLAELSINLSSEKDKELLLEDIVTAAQDLTNANAGTLYLITDQKFLFAKILINKDLDIFWGANSDDKKLFAPIPLYNQNGTPNHSNIVSFAVLAEKTINIADAYQENDFDFSGTKKIDSTVGYRSKSFLTIPLKDHRNNTIGALQLINCQDPETKEIIQFDKYQQLLAESLASHAAVTLTTNSLIEKQRELFENFIKLIAHAIDEKSPHTGEHCARVPILTLMLANAVNDITTGKFKDFQLTKEQLYELKIASWLHDCGKVTTPEHVINKATKLESIFDGVRMVDLRLEIIKRDFIIKELKEMLDIDEKEIPAGLNKKISSFEAGVERDRQCIHEMNIGGEWLSDAAKQLIEDISNKYSWQDNTKKYDTLLSAEEILNLQITKGTLNEEERKIIRNHVSLTISMLESLDYPEELQNVPEIAGGHHEKIDGSGYPKGLTGDVMSIQAKILVIADVFEALTAMERPYKKALHLTESLKILSDMHNEGKIDGDLFNVFVKSKVYLEYARAYLQPKQINGFDEGEILSLLESP